MDRRPALFGAGSDGDPVADGRHPVRAGFVLHAARGLGAQLAELGEEDVGAAMLRGDARREEALHGVRFEISCVAVSPAEVVQCVQARLLEREWLEGRAESTRACAAQELPEVWTDGLRAAEL